MNGVALHLNSITIFGINQVVEANKLKKFTRFGKMSGNSPPTMLNIE